MENEYKEKCWACHDSGIVLSEASSLDGESSNHEHPCALCPEGLKRLNEKAVRDAEGVKSS